MTTPNNTTVTNNTDNRINNTPTGDGAVNGSTTNTQPTGLGCSDGVSTGGRENDPQSVHFSNPQGYGSARQRQCQEQQQRQQLHNSNTTTSQGGSSQVGDTTSTSKVTGSGNSENSNHNSAQGGAGGTGVGVGVGKGGESSSSSAAKSNSGGNTQVGGSNTATNGNAATGGATVDTSDRSINSATVDARVFSNPGLPSQPGRVGSFGCNTVATASNGAVFSNSNTGAVIGTGFGLNGYAGTAGGGISFSSAKVIQGNGVCATQTTVDQGFNWLFAQPAVPVRSQSESAAGQGQGQAVIINMPSQPAQPPRVERRRASAESSNNYVAMVQVDTHVAPAPQFGLLDAFASLFG